MHWQHDGVTVADTRDCLLAGLKSNNWGVKHASAEAAADMAAAGADSVSDQTPALAAALLAELPGRLWEGKASVLKALAALCKACPQAFQAASSSQGAGLGARVVEALYAAAGKQNVAFRQAALGALETALFALQEDHFATVSPLLLNACRDATTPAVHKVCSHTVISIETHFGPSIIMV